LLISYDENMNFLSVYQRRIAAQFTKKRGADKNGQTLDQSGKWYRI